MAASAPPLEDEGNIHRSPELPFVSAIVGGLFPGRAIVLSGMVQPSFASDAKRFSIDLCCGLLIQGDHMDNKALHFNPRFEAPGGWLSAAPDRDVVINSFVSNNWGAEERFKNPFEEGKPFQIRILALESYFKIAVNGKHLCDYAYRVPLAQIKTIFITGNIRLDYVEFQPPLNNDGQPVNPSQNQEELQVVKINRPAIPFTFDLPVRGFRSPHRMQFTITPFISSERFCINLLNDDEFVFHFRVDMPKEKEKPALVRNSTKDGVWQAEERAMGQFPFNKGITHDVVFHAYGSSVAVDVDSLSCCKFTYRPGCEAFKVNRVSVTGDVVLHRFVYKNRD